MAGLSVCKNAVLAPAELGFGFGFKLGFRSAQLGDD